MPNHRHPGTTPARTAAIILGIAAALVLALLVSLVVSGASASESSTRASGSTATHSSARTPNARQSTSKSSTQPTSKSSTEPASSSSTTSSSSSSASSGSSSDPAQAPDSFTPIVPEVPAPLTANSPPVISHVLAKSTQYGPRHCPVGPTEGIVSAQINDTDAVTATLHIAYTGAYSSAEVIPMTAQDGSRWGAGFGVWPSGTHAHFSIEARDSHGAISATDTYNLC